MLSISGMLGPSSPVPQRPSWYENQSEQLSEPEERHLSKALGTSVMERPRNRQGLQALLDAVTPPEPSSPEESLRSSSRMSSLSGVVWTTTPFNQNQDRKRKTSDVDQDQSILLNQNRFAASLSPIPKKKRAPRPQYTKEQEDFIWFCRDDLSMSWRKVVELYNNYWHPFEVEPHIRSESGLQSRYYRILDFPVKIRKKKEPSRPDLGLIPSTQRRYPWMGVIKADLQERETADRNARCNTIIERDAWTTRDDRGEKRAHDETSSETEMITKSESTYNNHERPETTKSKKRNSPEPTELRSQVISHTLETDSETEHDQAWETSGPSISISYERYSSKPMISNEDIRTPLRFAGEGPICLPPLRRYLSHIISYEESDSDDCRQRAREKQRSNYGCKIPVTNLCV